MENLVGITVRRYKINRLVGQGGMATVFEAVDLNLERKVAIKFIQQESVTAAKFDHLRLRFEREAKALARLAHPHIVPIYDYGDYEGLPFLVMEYIPAGTLKSMFPDPIPFDEAAMLLVPIAEALDYAHQQGIIHRDVKPANILMKSPNYPVLTDFGIAKLAQTDVASDLTGTGMGIGTPDYMAPEQGLGNPVDSRTDIYSLGVVYYKLVTGRKPFEADTPMGSFLKKMSEPVPSPSEFVLDIPIEAENLIIKALSKDPDDRYSNAYIFARVLEKLGASAKERREAEERTRREAADLARREAARRARQEAEERARQEAEERKQQEAEERARREAASRARQEAEERARQEVEERKQREAEERKRRQAEAKVSPAPETAPIPVITPTDASATVDYLQGAEMGVETIVPAIPKPARPPKSKYSPSAETIAVKTLPEKAPVEKESLFKRFPWLIVAGPGALIVVLAVITILVLSAIKGSGGEATETPEVVAIATDVEEKVPEETPTQKPTAPETENAATETAEEGDEDLTDEVELVFIEAGSLRMGSEEGDSDESPVHDVQISAFAIDKIEVTNAMYARCVAAGACTEPASFAGLEQESYYHSGDFANYPVVGVSWDQASTYCGWAGRRLPTEAEWEMAARGPEGRLYPWGDDAPGENYLNFNGMLDGPAEVGSYPQGASPAGVLDLTGNVWEWVNDWYAEDYYSISDTQDPTGPESGEYRVVRGGAWYTEDYEIRSTYRHKAPPTSVDDFIGFRCAMDAEE